MAKPHFMSTQQWVYFRGETLASVLRQLADYLDEHQEGNSVDGDLPTFSYNPDGDEWPWTAGTIVHWREGHL